MVEASSSLSGTRATVFAEVTELAKKHIDAGYPEAKRDDSKNYVVNQDMSGALPVTVASITTADATLAQFDKIFSNYLECAGKADDKMTFTKLGEEEGATLFHCHMKTPFILNDKSYIGAFYHVKTDNEVTFAVSTKGNEAAYTQYADKMNKKHDVSDIRAQYFNVKEADGKITFTWVIDMHPGGSIPGPMKGKMAEKQQGGLLTWVTAAGKM